MKHIKTLFILGIILFTTCILANNGKPDLWKVEKNGNVSYLFGSIHLGSKDMYPLSDIVSKAYQRTSDLVVEIDISPSLQANMMPLIQKYGMDTQVPMEKRLSPKGLSIYQNACKAKKLPCEQFSSFKGWLVGTQITNMEMQK
ncbi:MAG: TraB/GumN family protein, partial [Kangiellaceae bacterium]|nr:TraB/GumN family protein [Kangiellaceae bacterium]